MDEITTLRELRPAPTPTELEAMRTSARQRFVAGTGSRAARQKWRLPALAGGLTAAAAAAAAATLVLTSGPAVVLGQQGPAGHATTVVTAAWTVHEDSHGTVTIYLRQYANPAGLQRTLRADGINAIVRRIPSDVVRMLRPTPSLPLTRKPGPPASPSRKKTGFGSKAGLSIRRPACMFATGNNAPRAVQRAVVSFAGQDLPVAFIIHPDAMPPGSALFLTFLNGMPSSSKNDNSGVMAMKPVVLNNDTVPACVRVRPKGTSSPAPKTR